MANLIKHENSKQFLLNLKGHVDFSGHLVCEKELLLMELLKN